MGPDSQTLPMICGYAAVFGAWTTVRRLSQPPFRERICRGAFAKVIRSNPIVPMKIDHLGQGIASTEDYTLVVREDDYGLRFLFAPPVNDYGRQAVDLVRRGDIRGASFEFRSLRSRHWHADGSAYREIVEVGELLDVSLAFVPAYEATSVGLVNGPEDFANFQRRARLKMAEAIGC